MLPLMGGAFSVVWVVVWRGTRFWDRRRFWWVFTVGWAAALVIYVAWWRYDPPPPIPTRIIVTPDRQQMVWADWRPWFVARAIERRLQDSKKSFIVLTCETTPLLAQAGRSETDLEQAARRLWVRWIVTLGDSGGSPAQVWKRRGSGFRRVAEAPLPAGPFARAAEQCAGDVAARLGDRGRGRFGASAPAVSDGARQALYAALQMRRAGSADSAAALLERLCDENPGWALPRQEWAALWMERQHDLRGEEIQRRLLEALDADSADAETYILLARDRMNFRRWDEAEAAAKMALHYCPNDPRALYYLSQLASIRYQDLPDRIRHKADILRRALVQNPGYEAARMQLMEYFRPQQEYTHMTHLAEDGLEINPRSTALLLNLSATQMATNRNEEVVATCERILSLNPRHHEALYNMGMALVWLGEYDRAITALDSSYNNGGTIESIYYKGLAYLRKRDFEAATRQFQLRLSLAQSSEDKYAISCREMIKRIKRWQSGEESVIAIPQ
jgi:tetratricopeptide (TPR) repeat protein